ncbi:hypothetical protein [Streptomyces glycanivorans]|uniref:Uncharacterized protein n=1 Tax=Streptomyces glycanivorans TaxID=3033808 RepID=A0ABY9JT42_9ACTN|nr:hypothetical protein [Streptomyces sp. Alt3]WLQ69181.1 hypothetical protein P8A20_37195 [Streptomyces sp. Alt3]
MSKKPNPFKDRQARRQGTAPLPEQQSAASIPADGNDSSGLPAGPQFAQGRPEKLMTLSDLPAPVETPHATGDLSDEEEQILALCLRGIAQFEDAWWVMGKAMANISSRRLYRKTHATFEGFARDVFKKSRPIAYEEMTSYAIGELLSARADKAFEGNSNGVSARADIPVIGKKVAGALNPVTKDYGPEASIAVHETIKDATGGTVTVKAIKGVVQQLPRKRAEELTREELTARARKAAEASSQDEEAEEAPLRQAVSRRTRQLADDLKRGRISRQELHGMFEVAFVDADDQRVYQALVRWMKDRETEPRE